MKKIFFLSLIVITQLKTINAITPKKLYRQNYKKRLTYASNRKSKMKSPIFVAVSRRQSLKKQHTNRIDTAT